MGSTFKEFMLLFPGSEDSLYNATSKEWISYDDPESIRLKGEYVAAQKLAGAMFWELSHDNGALLDALRAGLQSGR